MCQNCLTNSYYSITGFPKMSRGFSGFGGFFYHANPSCLSCNCGANSSAVLDSASSGFTVWIGQIHSPPTTHSIKPFFVACLILTMFSNLFSHLIYCARGIPMYLCAERWANQYNFIYLCFSPLRINYPDKPPRTSIGVDCFTCHFVHPFI